MRELNHKEGWVPKNWAFPVVVLKKTLESPLAYKEIKPVQRKGNQPWLFIGRTDVEAEAAIFWPPDVKSWLIGKNCDAGKDWGQKERGQRRIRWFDSITDLKDLNFSRLWSTEKPGVLHSLGLQRVGHDLATERQQENPRVRAYSLSLQILSF